jgi:hypothetical protein
MVYFHWARWVNLPLSADLDEQLAAVELRDGLVHAPAGSDSGLSADGCRMLEAIANLPEGELEAFDLVRGQGMTQAEAALPNNSRITTESTRGLVEGLTGTQRLPMRSDP